MLSLFGFPSANKVTTVCSSSGLSVEPAEAEPLQEVLMKESESEVTPNNNPTSPNTNDPPLPPLARNLKKGGYKKTRSKKCKVKRPTRSRHRLSRAAT